jgi:hypothetical protein
MVIPPDLIGHPFAKPFLRSVDPVVDSIPMTLGRLNS